jgi:hypothetical protein
MFEAGYSQIPPGVRFEIFMDCPLSNYRDFLTILFKKEAGILNFFLAFGESNL